MCLFERERERERVWREIGINLYVNRKIGGNFRVFRSA